jgi:hypothetical protein
MKNFNFFARDAPFYYNSHSRYRNTFINLREADQGNKREEGIRARGNSVRRARYFKE